MGHYVALPHPPLLYSQGHCSISDLIISPGATLSSQNSSYIVSPYSNYFYRHHNQTNPHCSVNITCSKFTHFPPLFSSYSKPSQFILNLSVFKLTPFPKSFLNIALLLFCRGKKIIRHSSYYKLNLYFHLPHILPDLRTEVFFFQSKVNSSIMLSMPYSPDLTSRSGGHKPAASASSGNLSEMLYLKPQPRLSDSEPAFLTRSPLKFKMHYSRLLHAISLFVTSTLCCPFTISFQGLNNLSLKSLKTNKKKQLVVFLYFIFFSASNYNRILHIHTPQTPIIWLVSSLKLITR